MEAPRTRLHPLLSATTKVALPRDHERGREEVGFAGRADRCLVRRCFPSIITCIMKLHKSYNSFKHLVYNFHLNCMAILPPLLNSKYHWRTHNSKRLVPVFNQLNKCNVLTSYLFVPITLKGFILQIFNQYFHSM